ncbi:hypothetical protein C8F01DRAFT_1372706 [Mycena amicta]|nr:hypothetical protein C8F01DRAFT_1372706 [Mycena amicta]
MAVVEPSKFKFFNPGVPNLSNVVYSLPTSDKGATTFFAASSEGGDIRVPTDPNAVCPNSTTDAFHTKGLDDLTGCALAIAYKNDARDVQPEDFVVFSVNQICVWTRFTDFQVPARMPACPEGGCTCAFFWIHSPDSGGEQNDCRGTTVGGAHAGR